ncbi:uncharacterized protein [Halyomorpha halys]|nr:uncharacterized protein LOC106680087 isoform X2 [Halyomorpha halys]
MAQQKQIEFENLPSHLLEYIFYYIPLIEIVRLCAVSPIFHSTGNVVIRKRFFELRSDIYKELKALKEELDELPKSEMFFENRIVLLRCHYFLEMILSELSLIRAVWRKALYTKSSSVLSIGKLLHEFYSAFYITKRRQLPPWHINDEIEGKVIKYAKLFFECKLDEVQYDEMFGSQILDVLDSMINRQFRINVKYYPQKNLCCIDAVYKLRDPHYLNRTPKINENGITEEDRRKILTYFVSLVRINNRVALREEQYHREVEISRSREINIMALEIDFILHGSSSWLTKDVRKYVSVLDNPQREEKQVDEIFEFEETYYSSEFSHSATMEK